MQNDLLCLYQQRDSFVRFVRLSRHDVQQVQHQLVKNHNSQVLPSSSNCLLENFRKGVVAQRYERRDAQLCEDSYMVRNDDIFERTTQLYEGEGTLGDITICSSIQCPQYFVEMI